MTTKNTCRLPALLFSLTYAVAATGVSAQTAPHKMTTPMTPGIAMPDSVPTRLGTLTFFYGFPDEQTAGKIYDNLDFQRAVQAYLLGLPLVNMAGLREGLLSVGPANVTIPTLEDNMNAQSLFLMAIATTLHRWVWIHLHDGPLVVEVPPMTLDMIDYAMAHIDASLAGVCGLGQIAVYSCCHLREGRILRDDPNEAIRSRILIVAPQQKANSAAAHLSRN